jgi:hypothetical protein
MVSQEGGDAVIVEIARQIALYLESAGEGTIGSQIFVDENPESPDELIALMDIGGNAGQTLASLIDTSGNAEYTLDAADTWRRLKLQVRGLTPSAAHQRIWQLINRLLEPAESLIAVNGTSYTVQMKSLPAIQPPDPNNRSSISCVLEVRKVSPVVHPWLEALSIHSESVLGAEWTVYRGIPGTRRPCLVWQIVGLQTLPATGSVVKMAMKCVGQILAKDADEFLQAAANLIERMEISLKLPLNVEMHNYVTLANPVMDIRPNDIATGQVTLNLIGTLNRPSEPASLMADVHTQFNLNR